MKWFNTYHSNTLAGSGNQSYFLSQTEDVQSGRVYYKVYEGGRYRYSLLFSNIIDSTYADGTYSHCNLICDEWRIEKLTIGVCKDCNAASASEPEAIYPVTFQGKGNKVVMPGEFFTTDPVEIQAKKGEYICVEIEFCGNMIPYHEESILPIFVKKNGNWLPSKEMPLPGMLGCDRVVKANIGFVGDSITQGIGTEVNSYRHWNAVVAEEIGSDYSYWNLGIGYGRASDAASDGAWLYKAKQMDMLVMCYGTNDVLHGGDEEQIKRDLLLILQKLKQTGAKVLLQTLPPFDMQDVRLETWIRVNDYVRNTLSEYADGFFDVVPILIDGEESIGKTKYGGHPNEEGCQKWAEALIPIMKEFV